MAGYMRYAQQFSAELRCLRTGSRVAGSGPRASPFAPDFPESSCDALWLLYQPSQSQVAPSLRLGPFCLLSALAQFDDLTGGLSSSLGYVYQYAGRAQAPGRLFARFWTAPAASRRNRAMATRPVAEGVAMYFRVMCRVSQTEAPCGFNAVLDTVAGCLVHGVVKKSNNAAAQSLSVYLLGAAPAYGKYHLCSPSDARPWCRDSDGYVAVRQMLPHEDVATASEGLRHQWRTIERGRSDSGEVAAQFEFVAGCPVQFFVGGVGGNRSRGMRPMLASFVAWRDSNVPMVIAEGVSMDTADECWSGLENWPSARRGRPLVVAWVFPRRAIRRW